MFLVPNKGTLVRYPHTMEILPAEGANVDIDSSASISKYWRRRIICGDVTVREDVKEVKEEKKFDVRRKTNDIV